MLRITGKCLGVSTETVSPREGATWKAFEKTTISLLVDGPGGRPRVEEIEAGRDLQATAQYRIQADEEVTLAVTISAFNTRYGGDYRLTASEIVEADTAAEPLRAVSGEPDF